ncbi:hypothetical protein [Microvirga arabica]|uniref:hypothetical protein n=1 Tax=Microvirga arabica TaxID=1128671 RepID=UPI00193AC8C4|nr:hypothetical protein [Microvirga arabica]MBM1169619.1 hypothetical protein [Microvirga arabica]
MTNLREQIADLVTEIDGLFEAAEQCRKGMVVARVATVACVPLFMASLFGADPA